MIISLSQKSKKEPYKSKETPKNQSKKNMKNKKLTVKVETETSDSDSYADPGYGSDITDELSEEEYQYSDEK